MTEFAKNNEAQTQYQTALGNFFDVLHRNAASEGHIRMALAELLGATTGNGIKHELYLDNWSSRHSYDARGVLVDNDGYIDNGEGSDGPETPEIINRKLALLADVSAFLIGSKHSLLDNKQKEALVYKVGAFFDVRGRHHELADTFGAAVAPYMAHDIDMIAMAGERGDYESDDRLSRIARGRFILQTLDRPPYLRGSVGRVLSRGLREARRN